MEKICVICNNLLKKQKKYCSRQCQYIGLSNENKSSNIQIKECDYCKKEYEFHPTWKNCKKTKYCSRSCKDMHQKIKYVGSLNPNYNKKPSKETTELRIQSMKKYWNNEFNRKNRSNIMKNLKFKLGYHPGTGRESIKKRKITNKTKYGFEHPWKNPEIRKKCETTTYNLYGKYTWEIAKNANKKISKIELLMVSILESLKIDFIHSYSLEVDSVRREFDFYIPHYNTLIECDGDYWHAHPEKYNILDEIQINNLKNDKIKNEMALSHKVRLLRFWESDIIKDDFANKLRDILCQKNLE